MNGWTLVLKKLSGREKRKKSYCIQLKFSRVNGGPLLQQQGEQLINVLKNMNDYLIKHREKMKRMKMTQESLNPVKLIQFLKQEHQNQISKIWMKMKRRCLLKQESDWLIHKEKKQKEEQEKNIFNKQEDLLYYKSKEK